MAKVTHTQMWEQLQQTFPGLIDWLPTDREYLLTTVKEVRAFMDRYHDQRLRPIPYLYECEEYSLALLAAIRNERGLLAATGQLRTKERYNLAIGEALGLKFEGVGKRHQVNIFLTTDGFYLADCQSQRTWRAEKGRDELFFVRF